jgi:putative ABC transport system permease protein
MFWNTLLLALREIRRNLMRSFLTVLGIVIGVASVITMVTLGNGATQEVTSQIASLGSNLVMIAPGRRMGPQSSSAPAFKVEDAEAIGREISGVAAVAPVASGSASAIYGHENWATSLTGTSSTYIKLRNLELAGGRNFSESEAHAGAAVCIIGETVRQKLFGSQDPVNKRIRLKALSFQIIGLLEAKGQSGMGQDQDDVVLLPLRTFQRRISGNQDVSFIMVSMEDGVSTSKAQRDIRLLMRNRRHLAANDDDNFQVMDTKELTRMLTATTQLLTGLLGAVAAVSLLVGGIGIMNIMLVSVTERTREVGTRLAIGALEREVLMQFLVEAVALSSSGGMFGILLGLGASLALKSVLKVPFVPDLGIVMIAFLFSAAVGVVFGYFPALKAARLDPIEALRHE